MKSRKSHFNTNVRVNEKTHRFYNRIILLFWKISPRFTEGFIKHFFFNPGKYKSTSEEIDILENSVSFRIRVHDKKLKIWKWGNEPGILLVHGWNGRGIQFHKFIKPLVNAGYTPIIFDGPAHGDSEGRHTSYFEFSDAVRELMHPKHGLNIKAIVGHSMGASAAINCLSKDRNNVKLVLIAPAFFINDTLNYTLLKFGVSQKIFDGIIEKYEKKYGYSLKNDDPINLIGDLDTDILIIHDAQDRATPLDESKKIASTHDNIRLVTTDGYGHSRIVKQEDVVEKTIHFISSININQTEQIA